MIVFELKILNKYQSPGASGRAEKQNRKPVSAYGAENGSVCGGRGAGRWASAPGTPGTRRSLTPAPNLITRTRRPSRP